jgi:hypothetical protein
MQTRNDKRLFRKVPSREFVDDILVHLKLQGLTDKRWFTRDELNLDGIDEWLPLLEPYYLPCKAKRFLNDMDSSRVITILRHILHPIGFELRTQEKMYKMQKTTMYQLYSEEVVRDLSANQLRVDFS